MYANALIVDDNPLDRKIISNLLEKENFVTIECADGYEALDKIESCLVDIIFLDIKMPGINGIQLLKRLSEFSRRNNIPILMMSANRVDKQGILLAHQYGALDFLVKPIQKITLIEKIERLKANDKINSQTRVTLPNESITLLNHGCEILDLDLHGMWVRSEGEMIEGQTFSMENTYFSKFGLQSIKVVVETSYKENGGYQTFLSFKNTPEHQFKKVKQVYQSLLENYKNHAIQNEGRA